MALFNSSSNVLLSKCYNDKRQLQLFQNEEYGRKICFYGFAKKASLRMFQVFLSHLVWIYVILQNTEAGAGGVPLKKVFLRISQNSHKNTCVTCNFIKKRTLTQVFSCEFWEIFKNTFFTEHLRKSSENIVRTLAIFRNSYD